MRGQIVKFVPMGSKNIRVLDINPSTSLTGDAGYISLKNGVWEANIRKGYLGVTVHQEGKRILEQKLNALNNKLPLERGGDPLTTETWQDGAGITEQI